MSSEKKTIQPKIFYDDDIKSFLERVSETGYDIVPITKFIQKQYSQPQYSTNKPPITGPKPLATENAIEFKLIANGILSYSQYYAVILNVFDMLNAPAIP